MIQQRIFVLWTHPLFKDAVIRLLVHPQIELIGDTANYGNVEEQISMLRPDLILVEEPESDHFQDVFNLLKSRILAERIMLLNLIDNQVNVYSRKQKIMASTEDFVRLCLSTKEDDSE